MLVKKKAGHLEEFDREKIMRTVVAAEFSQEEAEGLAYEIEARVSEIAESDTVPSSSIRRKVIEILRLRDPESARRFEEYKKES